MKLTWDLSYMVIYGKRHRESLILLVTELLSILALQEIYLVAL